MLQGEVDALKDHQPREKLFRYITFSGGGDDQRQQGSKLFSDVSRKPAPTAKNNSEGENWTYSGWGHKVAWLSKVRKEDRKKD